MTSSCCVVSDNGRTPDSGNLAASRHVLRETCIPYKLSAIRTGVSHTPPYDDTTLSNRPCRSTLAKFHLATEDGIKWIVLASPSKTCEFGPISTSLLKQCLDALLISINFQIPINKTPEEGTFPSLFKNAHAAHAAHLQWRSPHRQKRIWKTSFIPVYCQWCRKELSAVKSSPSGCNKYDKFFSVAEHCTQPRLLSTKFELTFWWQWRKATLLLLFLIVDPSAASDTILHGRLRMWFGVSGVAFKWFSFLPAQQNSTT